MATRKSSPRTAPRKRPRQERSQATVDAILEAAAREFVDEGYAGATTNRIAVLAGISVGSLYQYFPSKEAIAVELARQFRASRLTFVSERLASIGNQPLETVVSTLFDSLLKAEGIRPELYRVLIEKVWRTSARDELRGYEERLEAVCAQALRSVRPPPDVEDFELVAFMLVRLTLALIHSANVDGPRHNTPVLVKELTKLVLRYLGVRGSIAPKSDRS